MQAEGADDGTHENAMHVTLKAEHSTCAFAVVAAVAWPSAVLALSVPYADIDSVRSWGGDTILDIQSQGSSDVLMSFCRGLSYIGDDITYIAVLPILLFGVSYEVGSQAFILFCFSLMLNNVLKTLLYGPRPSWIFAVSSLSCEVEYGNPSFHSQAAFTMYLFAARRIIMRCRTRVLACWCAMIVWFLATLLAVAVSASRFVIGAHFPHQVLAGAFLGIAGFGSFELLCDWDKPQAWIDLYIADLKGGIIAAACVSLCGCTVGVVSWVITAAHFRFPDGWAENAAAACGDDDDESIDEFGGVRYIFFAAGLLASLVLSHGKGTLPAAMGLATRSGAPFWHRVVRSSASVLVSAGLYFSIGAAISKSWHIALVLLLRYYMRAFITGAASFLVLPPVFQKMNILPATQSGAPNTP